MGEEDDDSTYLHLSIALHWSKYNTDKLHGNHAVLDEWMSFKLLLMLWQVEIIKLAYYYYYSTPTKMVLLFVILIDTMRRENLLPPRSNMLTFLKCVR